MMVFYTNAIKSCARHKMPAVLEAAERLWRCKNLSDEEYGYLLSVARWRW